MKESKREFFFALATTAWLVTVIFCIAGCLTKKVEPPVVPPIVAGSNAPAEWFPGLLITFPTLPDAETAAALAEAGASLSLGGTGRVWALPQYDRHNQFQQTALEWAMKAGATIGPLRP